MSMDLDKAGLFEEYGYFDVEEGRELAETDTQGILVTKELLKKDLINSLTSKKISLTINNLPLKCGNSKPLKAVVKITIQKI